MTKEEILNEINNFKHQVNQRIADFEAELKKFDSGHARVDFSYWEDDEIDNERYNAGNCLPTKGRVEQVAEKIKMLLKLERYHDMFCPDYVPDWENHTQKYYVFYNFDNERWEYNFHVSWKTVTQVYFDSEEAAQKVCDLLNREEENNL